MTPEQVRAKIEANQRETQALIDEANRRERAASDAAAAAARAARGR